MISPNSVNHTLVHSRKISAIRWEPIATHRGEPTAKKGFFSLLYKNALPFI